MNGVFMSHASIEFNANIMAKPIRVAIEELQLKDLQNIDAAVDVKQNAKPARQEDATVPSTPASGRERRRPIVSLDGQANSVRSGVSV